MLSSSPPICQGRPDASIRRPQSRIPFHFAHILTIHVFPYAVPFYFAGLTLKVNYSARSINVQNLCRASPTRRALAVRHLTNSAGFLTFTSAHLNALLFADTRRNFHFDPPFWAASCAIIRNSHCCANCPGNEVSYGKSESSSLPPRPKRPTGLDPKTSMYYEYPQPEISAFKHH